MSDAIPSLYLVTPLVTEPDAIVASIAEACRSGAVAAVLVRLAGANERTLVNRIKAIAPAAQAHGAALLVGGDVEFDLVTIAGRGGADGVHVSTASDLRALRERLADGRILGTGGLRTKHDAMAAGEAGADYVMFGEPKPDGFVPPLEGVIERAQWWAEIFATPCVAFAPTLADVATLAATGAEFVAVGDAVWRHPAGAQAAVDEVQALLLRVAAA